MGYITYILQADKIRIHFRCRTNYQIFQDRKIRLLVEDLCRLVLMRRRYSIVGDRVGDLVGALLTSGVLKISSHPGSIHYLDTDLDCTIVTTNFGMIS